MGAPYQPRAHRTRNWHCRVAAMMGAGLRVRALPQAQCRHGASGDSGGPGVRGPAKFPIESSSSMDSENNPAGPRGQQAHWQGMRLPSITCSILDFPASRRHSASARPHCHWPRLWPQDLRGVCLPLAVAYRAWRPQS